MILRRIVVTLRLILHPTVKCEITCSPPFPLFICVASRLYITDFCLFQKSVCIWL